MAMPRQGCRHSRSPSPLTMAAARASRARAKNLLSLGSRQSVTGETTRCQRSERASPQSVFTISVPVDEALHVLLGQPILTGLLAQVGHVAFQRCRVPEIEKQSGSFI